MKKALIVDDTKNIRVLLTKCLQLNNYEVISCANGDDALLVLEKETFELIFLDVKMPGMSGTEVLRRLRGNGILTKVVMITAFATVKNAIDCTKMGVVEYLHKPFTAEKISNVIKRLEELEENNESNKEVERIICATKKLIAKEKFNDGIIILKRALAINPEIDEIYFLLGECYEGIGDREKAKKFYSCSEMFNK